MSDESGPMFYARVVRALAAAGEEPQALNGSNCERIAEFLNREFKRLGIKVDPSDLRGRKSAVEIAEIITGKVAG
jgi:hypothetical protein